MPTLQVRDVPYPIYEKLKAEAEKKHRSLAQQAIITLAKGLETGFNPKRRRLEVIEKIRKSQTQHSLSDPSQLIREDRER